MTHGHLTSDDPVSAPTTAGVLAPPPVLYVVALLVAFVLNEIAPLPLTHTAHLVLRVAGGVAIVAGLALSTIVTWEFHKAKTAISPLRPTTHLVMSGPHRYSRNPDYIGQTLVYVGIALMANSWWPIILLPIVLVVIRYGVIAREERYLEALFGQEYRDYAARVRRWL